MIWFLGGLSMGVESVRAGFGIIEFQILSLSIADQKRIFQRKQKNLQLEKKSPKQKVNRIQPTIDRNNKKKLINALEWCKFIQTRQ